MLNIKHEDFVFRISREQSRCFHEHYEAGYEIDLCDSDTRAAIT